MLLRTKKNLLCVLAIVCVMLFAAVGITGFTSMTAHAYKDDTLPTGENAIGNLYDGASKKFSAANLNALARKAGYTDVKDMMAKAQAGETKQSSAFGETVVYFGKDAVTQEELAWIPAYLSRDTDGNAVLTLLLAKTQTPDSTHNQEVSEWNETSSTTAHNPASSNYSTSMMRVKTLNNGGTWYTYNYNDDGITANTFKATNNGSNKFEAYTTGELAQYITVPNKVGWQTARSTVPNDLGYVINDVSYTKAWGNDKLWLPSSSEFYSNFWDLSNIKRDNRSYTWTRSTDGTHYGGANYYNGGVNYGDGLIFIDNVAMRYAVRPALHLNLNAAADTAFDNLNFTVRVAKSESDTSGVGFYDLSVAFDAALAGDYAKIKLLSDVTIDATLETGKDNSAQKITLDLNGKELKYTGSSGSVIRVGGNSEFTLTDSEKDVPEAQRTEHIVNGYTVKGGVITGGKGIMMGGELCGGGVYVDGTFIMDGGTIAGNTAEQGGGVYAYKFTMNGGEISHNTAEQGGGVYASVGTLSVSGDSKITDNTGGGVFYGNAAFTVRDAVKISGNKNRSGVLNNITTNIGSNRINVGTLNAGAEIYVHDTGAVVTGFTAANNPQNAKPSDIFKSDDSGKCAYMSDESAGVVTIGVHTGGTATCQKKAVCENCGEEYGELNPDNHNYVNGICACGATAHFEVTVGNGSPVTKETFEDAWTYANEQSNNDTPATVKLLDNAIINLADTFTGTKVFTVETGKNIILDLNGYKLEIKANKDNVRVISVSGTFTLDDSTKDLSGKNTHVILDSVKIKGGLITGGTNVGVYVYNGIFTMNGGTIAGNGGGVYINGGGNFTMNDGAISYNTKTSSVGSGGGVEIQTNGTFTMNDGVIAHNTASRGGGVTTQGTFTMKGGTIEYNTATNSTFGGGGVYSSSGTFNVSGNPKIRNNVTIKNDSEISNNVGFYSDGKITVNGALGADAVIYVAKTGARITGFTAANNPQNLKPSAIFKSDNTTQSCIYISDESSGTITIGSHYTYNIDFTVDKNPTCTEEGSKSQHCRYCDEPCNVQTIPASHTLITVKQKDKTCTEDGVLAHDHCSVCGKDFINGVEQSADDLRIPSAGHSLTSVAQADKTCTTDGTLAHDHCSMCGKDFINNVEKTADELKIAAGHTLTAVAQVNKTCTTDGTLAHEHCSVCNKDFINNVEKTAEQLKIAAGHSFGIWINEIAATCSATGTKAHKDCSVCHKNFDNSGSEITDLTIAIDDNAHSWDEGRITTPATCTQAGVKTFTCEHNGEHTKTETVAIDSSAHKWDDGMITTPATCTQEGVKTFTCEHNGEHTRTEAVAIDATAHSFSADWTNDESGHWHAATCGHTAEKSGFAAHTASEWIVNTPAQIGVAGRKHKECTVCHYTLETAEIPAIEPDHEHTFATEWTSDASGHWHAATCEHISQKSGFAAHTAGDWIIDTPAQIGIAGSKHKECTVCGYTVETAEIPAIVHQHTFATEWTKDETGHWHAATCEHISQKGDFAAHTAGDWIIDTPAQIGVAGSKHKECTVCGYTLETAEIPAIPVEHEHTFSTEWSKDASGHWHAATCEHTDEKGDFAAHTAGDWIIDTPAQIGVAGSKHKECTVCGYVTETGTIPALKSELVKPGENGGENQVVVTTPNGFSSDIELVVTEIKDFGAYESVAQTVNGEIGFVYDVTLKSGGVTVQPDGTLTIKLRIPENLKDKNFKLFHLHGSEAADMEYNVDGGYAVVTTDKLSEFIFVGEKTAINPNTNGGNGSNGVWIALIVIMCVIILGEAGFFVYRYVFKKKRTEGKK